MSEKTEIEYNLTVNVEDARTNLQQVERMVMRVLALMQRLGLPPNMSQAIHIIQRFIMAVRALRVAQQMLLLGTPFGWVMGVTGLVMAGMDVGMMAYDIDTMVNTH